jgi:hypothetical protein
MHGTEIDVDVEINSTKLANETSPQTPMHEIEGRISENSAYRYAICGVKP